jgi:protein SCO1/2
MGSFNRQKKILILVLILAVPGFLYYLLTSQGKNRYKPLPFFGPKPLTGTYHTFHGKKIPDTLYHVVDDFNLQDQQGHPVSFKTIGPKILVVNFFYTHGNTVSKQVNASMDSVVKYFGRNKLIRFASITVDPQRDKPEVLKQYAARFTDAGDKWLFLTGDTSVIYPLARKGLLVDALQNGNDFVFSNKIIVLDSERRIRGYYAATNPDEITRLADELKVQITEELRKVDKPLY